VAVHTPRDSGREYQLTTTDGISPPPSSFSNTMRIADRYHVCG